MDSFKTYTCTIEYFATGEGLHVYIGIVRATSRLDAIKKFRKHFKFFDAPRCWNYFKIGLEIKNGIDNNKLSEYLSPKLIRHIKQHIAFQDLFLEFNFGSTL